MLYRKLDSNGDYTFGKGAGNFYKDSPDAVAQLIRTRLLLWMGEWFLDTTAGTPYLQQILGMGKIRTFDTALKDVISNTQGVTGISQYVSGYNPNTRKVAVNAIVDTAYGQASLNLTTSFTSSAGQQLDVNFILNSSTLA